MIPTTTKKYSVISKVRKERKKKILPHCIIHFFFMIIIVIFGFFFFIIIIQLVWDKIIVFCYHGNAYEDPSNGSERIRRHSFNNS